jgi:hypothetical protein
MQNIINLSPPHLLAIFIYLYFLINPVFAGLPSCPVPRIAFPYQGNFIQATGPTAQRAFCISTGPTTTVLQSQNIDIQDL